MGTDRRMKGSSDENSFPAGMHKSLNACYNHKFFNKETDIFKSQRKQFT
jgi:hypothetical protein